MENFITNFGTTLIIGSIVGLLLTALCVFAEKSNLGDKFSNMFNDKNYDLDLQNFIFSKIFVIIFYNFLIGIPLVRENGRNFLTFFNLRIL